ncbi:MAG: DUF3365 domain-containing protein [Fuerstiella sp.]|nr:hypothetical protein [Fuerstiella sp.]
MVRFLLIPTVLIVALAAAGTTSGNSSDEGQELAGESAEVSRESHEAKRSLAPVSVAEARRQASLLNETYMATLHVIHQQYFDRNLRDIVPPRAMEDVFKQIDERTKGQTRWISVNAPAMNVDHEPKPGFEKDAARALNGGSKEFERVENGLYHRAAPVKLFASCNRCHLSALSSRRTGRIAALVITLPVRNK